ncbi:MAG: TatD family hydrolase [Bacteroidota bacterium]
MFIDTHAHVYHGRFGEDREAMIERAFEAGVEKIVMPAIDVASIHEAIALSEQYEGRLFAMAAIHPSDVKEATEADFEAVVELCANPYVVAVGESGLDYYWDRTFDEKQHDYLRRHARLAMNLDLPLILHNREADADLVRILQEERAASETPERMRGIFHCFGGPASVADEALALGFHFGLGGTLTYKKSGAPAAIEHVPLDRLVLETDAPFLAPVPKRGKRNEPAFLPHTAAKLAELKGVGVEEVAKRTSETARSLFKI